jgi:hypothetical protein
MECPVLTIYLRDRDHFDTEPFQVTVQLHPLVSSLDVKLYFYESYHLPFMVSTISDSVLRQSIPENFHRNIYILAIGSHYPVTIDEVLTEFRSSQVPNTIADLDLWIVKCNYQPQTDIEEQRHMFNHVHYAPVKSPPMPDLVDCRAVTSLIKPECPEHVGQMVRSPFRVDFKMAHFENYDKMYQTGTWSYPVAKSLLPPKAVILPIRLAYSVKSTETDSLWEMQVRSCANGARMIEGVHFGQSYSPVAMIDSIHLLLILSASQDKQVYILDIRNAFQNMIEFDPTKRTYSILPPFFVDYIHLRWARHPDLAAVVSPCKAKKMREKSFIPSCTSI